MFHCILSGFPDFLKEICSSDPERVSYYQHTKVRLDRQVGSWYWNTHHRRSRHQPHNSCGSCNFLSLLPQSSQWKASFGWETSTYAWRLFLGEPNIHKQCVPAYLFSNNAWERAWGQLNVLITVFPTCESPLSPSLFSLHVPPQVFSAPSWSWGLRERSSPACSIETFVYTISLIIHVQLSWLLCILLTCSSYTSTDFHF